MSERGVHAVQKPSLSPPHLRTLRGHARIMPPPPPLLRATMHLCSLLSTLHRTITWARSLYQMPPATRRSHVHEKVVKAEFDFGPC